MNYKNRFVGTLLVLALTAAMLCGIAGCGLEVESIAQPETAETAAPKATAAPVETAEAEDAAEEPEIEEIVEEPEIEEIITGLLLEDDDADGIISYSFHYKGATVYAMFVLDPNRVILGTAVQEAGVMWGNGRTLDVLVEDYGAVGGMNAGVFYDPSGSGSGWPPTGITYNQGVCFNTEEDGPVAGIDHSGHFWAGYYSYNDCELIGIKNAVSFEPVFVQDGVKQDASLFESGIGARSAIGQREDGTIVLMVADGRQGYSIGLTLADVADLMYDVFECVNAVNMDGGNSSCMAFSGELVNNPSNQAGGTRALPTAWLILPQTADYTPAENPANRVILPFEEETERTPCPEEMLAGLSGFADEFTEAYYGFFGTSFADLYYPTLGKFVADGSELRMRMDLALMDRIWVNTYKTALSNKYLEAAYDNGDGSYTIEYVVDIVEYATYWTYEAPATHISITVVPNDYGPYGLFAIATE